MGHGVTDKRIFFLINPQAGGGAARPWWEKQQPLLDQLGIDYIWEYTAAAGTAGEQIRRAVQERAAEVVLAVGGDGTVYEAVNGIVAQYALLRPDLVFGVCPLGSGCDLARTIYGKNRISLSDLLRRGRVQPVDVACCSYLGSGGRRERHYYLNSFDMGAGADTCVMVNAGGGRIKRLTHSGKLAFLLSAVRVLLSFSYTEARVEADGQCFSGQYIIAGAGNGRYIGGGMMMFPQARLDDGKLDLLLVERRGRLGILRAFPKIYSGRHLQLPGITYTAASSISIVTERPLHIELDGEVPGFTDAALSVLPGILPLLLPDKD